MEKSKETTKETLTKVRLSADLSPSVADALRRLAANQGISLTEALGRAISTESYLQKKRSSGSTILVKDEGSRDLNELVFMPYKSESESESESESAN